jgi:hypothetical protein
MASNPPAHLRMPQRADAVSGIEPSPGNPTPTVSTDPRTASQEPVSKIKPALTGGGKA